MVSWPESSWSSPATLKHTFLMPPCSLLSISLSSPTRGDEEASSAEGGSQAPPDVGSVMVDNSLWGARTPTFKTQDIGLDEALTSDPARKEPPNASCPFMDNPSSTPVAIGVARVAPGI